MPLSSDLNLSASKFDPSAIPEATAQLNAQLIEIMENGPRWWEVLHSTLQLYYDIGRLIRRG